MNIAIWIFQNVLPGIGLCFIILTLIYFITFIILMIIERKDITSCFYVFERAAEISIIVNVISLLIILGIIYLVLTIRKCIPKHNNKNK